MFSLLSRALLVLLIGTVAYSLFQRFYPSGTYIQRVFVVILMVVLAFAFFTPTEPIVSSLWEVISFPLKPLGAAILMLIIAAQNMKGGGLEKPGGTLIGWALGILLVASTPAVAYLLVRAPIAQLDVNPIARQEITSQSQSQIQELPANEVSETLVALNPIYDVNVVSDSRIGILTKNSIDSTNLTFGSRVLQGIPSYLLQRPQEISRRGGLQLRDFVPSAETLQLTTNVWESYLNQVSSFIRGNR
ncbi:MAG: hypothetical protein AAF208_08365 [Cyanobacteria bacterium P01_A01_bin.45]